MITILIVLSSLVVAISGAFFVIRKLVMMWTGCTKEEAEKKIRAFVSTKKVYHLANDQMVNADLWNAVRSIIGDERFIEICRLAETSRMFTTGYASGLPFIALTVAYKDANEKMRLEHVLSDVMSSYLSVHGLCNRVISDWKENLGLRLPFIMLRYAESEEEMKILNAVLSMKRQQILQKYQPVLDKELEVNEADESHTTRL